MTSLLRLRCMTTQPPARDRIRAPQPDSIRVIADDPLTLKRRWFELQHLGWAATGLVFIVVGAGLYQAKAGNRFGSGLFVALGILAVYVALAGLLNATVVRVDRVGLRVLHGPLPWWGQRSVSVSDL